MLLGAKTNDGESSAVTAKLVKSQLDFPFVQSTDPIPPTDGFSVRQ